jgi:putative peptidoglycan lipid II flippase
VSIGGTLGVAATALIGGKLLHTSGLLPLGPTTPLPADISPQARAGFIAVVAATVITYANPVIDQWIASTAGPGAASMLGYASRLATGVVALVAGALGQILLITFSRQVAEGNTAALSATYQVLVRVMPWVGCSATLAVWLTSPAFVALLYQRGSFDAETSKVVAHLLDLYAVQFPVFWTSVAGGIMIFALSMNHILLRIGALLFVVNILSDAALLAAFGFTAIPLSTTVVLVVSMSFVNVMLHRSRRVTVRVSDWAYSAVPVSFLASAGLAVSAFDLSMTSFIDLGSAVKAIAVLVTFGACAIPFVRRDVQRYQAALSSAQRQSESATLRKPPTVI